jgi:23S rRNA U2552 (ribose-2'-O)-methylase RlmE/FtsJ
MIVLHEIQQQHKIITPGDWILDVGAGPNFYWTELALRLAED